MVNPEEPTQKATDISPDIQKCLRKKTDILKKAGPAYSEFRRELEALSQRVAKGTFHLAVLGQFKRGKSTLINALLGERLLPTSILPLTAIPTFIRFGGKSMVRVRYLAPDKPVDEILTKDTDALAATLDLYVTEKNNPENRLGVSSVDVLSPASILENGTVLIDTPGVGSTFSHNTRTTMSSLPRVDAALFVVSVDPPVTQTELDFLAHVKKNIPTLFFLLNKVDTLANQERADAAVFLRDVLKERVGPDIRVFPISAKQGLIARQKGNQALWESSGMSALEEHIRVFLDTDKDVALLKATEIKQKRVTDRAILSLHMEREGLKLPLEELDKKVALFREKSEAVRKNSRIIEDLITGEKRRIQQRLEERCAKLREDANLALREHVDRIILEFDANRKSGESIAMGLYKWVEDGILDMVPELFGREFDDIYGEFAALILDAINRHYKQAGDLILTIRKNAADLFDIPLHDHDNMNEFEAPKTPYWMAGEWQSRLGPIPTGMLDRFLPGSVVKKMVKRRVDEDIRLLVNKNVESLRWPMVQAINNSLTAFVSRLDKEVAGVIEGTDRAIAMAVRLKQEHGAEVRGRLEDLDTIISRLKNLT